MPTPQGKKYLEQLGWLKIGIAVIIVALGLYVSLSPTIVYAPTSRVVLFLLIAILPAILFGAEAASRFKMELKGFLFTTTGSFAACLGLLFLLNYLAKPEEAIAVYNIFDKNGQEIAIDWDGAIEIDLTERGLAVTKFVEENTVILVFPEQVGRVQVAIRRALQDQPYIGYLTYAGSRTARLVLGEDLVQQSP
ncbi:hypothetical protein KQI65_15805 [bacterium]|nr:hypothetical protein [bacterium]